jgi:hypothetical protein
MNKFALYRFIFPFRSRLQKRLRGERMTVDVDAFARGFEGGDRHPEIPRFLWEMLREEAFVPDFRPDPNDDLTKIYGKGPEEVQDDLIEPLLIRLGLCASGIDFRGFDFASVTTPKDAGRFVMKLADTKSKVT